MTYNFPFDKTLKMVTQPSGKKIRTWVPAYTPQQYAALETDLQTALAEDFIGFEVIDSPASQMTVVTYHGVVVDDVEQDQAAVIDPVYTAWMLANP